MTETDLEGKVVAVTGAAGRLGQEVVRRFGAHGAVVAAIVRSEEKARRVPLIEGAGGVFPVDVTDEAGVRACFEDVDRRHGRLDVLVHTVGAWEGSPLLETSLEDWERLMRVNLTSTFLCFREAARRMQGRGGRLIGIASGQGADGGRAQQGAYSAAKAGVVRLVEAAAAEFEGEGITAHAIAPSLIRYGEDGEGVAATDLVELCLFLCSPAGTALNGATLRAYGTKG